MSFALWLESQGCFIEVTQEDDGSGYVCLDVTTPDGRRFSITVEGS